MTHPVVGLVGEIKKCEGAGATTAAIAMCYVCVDTMAFLGLPNGRDETTRSDFIGWVEKYVHGHPDQPYQYRGIDLYAARCAVLHTYSAEAELHRKDSSVRQFGYSNGGLHFFKPSVSENLVIIGTASFINDVIIGVERFLKDAVDDADLRGRIEARVSKVHTAFPLSVASPTQEAE